MSSSFKCLLAIILMASVMTVSGIEEETTLPPDDDGGEATTMPPIDTTTFNPAPPSTVQVQLNNNGLDLKLTFSGVPGNEEVDLTADLSVQQNSQAESLICEGGSPISVYLINPGTHTCGAIPEDAVVEGTKITDFNKLKGYDTATSLSLGITAIEETNCFYILSEKPREEPDAAPADVIEADDVTTIIPEPVIRFRRPKQANSSSSSEDLVEFEEYTEDDLVSLLHNSDEHQSEEEIIRRNQCLSPDQQSTRYLSIPFLSPALPTNRIFNSINLANFRIIAVGSALTFSVASSSSSSSSVGGLVFYDSGSTYTLNPFGTFPNIQLTGAGLTAVIAIGVAVAIGYAILFFIFVFPGVGSSVSRVFDTGPAQRVSGFMSNVADRALDGLTNAVFSGIEAVSGVKMRRRSRRRKASRRKTTKHTVPYTADTGYYYNYYTS